MSNNLDHFVEKKLFAELCIRSKRLLIPHVTLIVLSCILLAKIHQSHTLSMLPYGIILLSLLVRILILGDDELFFLKRGRRFFLFLAMVMVTGFGWSWLFWMIAQLHGLHAVETLYCLGAIIILMAGGTTAFAASVPAAVALFVSLSSAPVIYLFSLGDNSSFILGGLIIMSAFYQTYLTTISARYLKESIRSELKALKKKDALQEFIDAIPGIVGFIDNEANYVMMNEYMGGVVKNKIIGTKVGETLPNNPLSKLILEFLKSDQKHIVKEVFADDLIGENWYMVNLTKISSPMDGVLAVVLPINDLVKAKNDLRIQKARAQYASKLASLGELSAGIAHEVNNPLTIIEGSAHLMKMILQESPEDVSSLDKAATKIIDTSQRIGKIIKSLRTLSADAEDEPFRNISFHSIVEPILEISKAKLESAGIKLTVIKHGSDVALFGNEIQLSQVIMNLVANSIDAIQHLEEKWIQIQYVPNYEWCDILVIDSGSGIPTEFHHRLMEPFYTTKESQQGTGLGLSISKNIVEIHNGTLSVLKDAKNTTFRVRLPRMTLWE